MFLESRRGRSRRSEGDGVLEEVSGWKCPGCIAPHEVQDEISFRLRDQIHLIFGLEEF